MCDFTYIGQTRRTLKKRATEHLKDYVLCNFDKSPIAEHKFEFEFENHDFPLNNLKLMKEVNDHYMIKIWESLFIHKYKKRKINLLNKDDGLIPISELFKLIK